MEKNLNKTIPDPTTVNIRHAGSSLHEREIEESLKELILIKGSLWVMRITNRAVKLARDKKI